MIHLVQQILGWSILAELFLMPFILAWFLNQRIKYLASAIMALELTAHPGATGRTGQTGDVGSPGPKGETGDTGPPGRSEQ